MADDVLSSPVDPYLLWRLTSDAEFAKAVFPEPQDRSTKDSTKLFAVLVERRDPAQPLFVDTAKDAKFWAAKFRDLNSVFAPMHTNVVDPSTRRPRFQPGLVNGYGLWLLINALRFPAVEAINLIRWELSHTGKPLDFLLGAGQPTSCNGPAAPGRRAAEVPPPKFGEVAELLARRARQAPVKVAKASAWPSSKRREIKVCVIDDGCAFASPVFGSGSASIVSEMLVQANDADLLSDLDKTSCYTPGLQMDNCGSALDVKGALVGRRLDPNFFDSSKKPETPPLSSEPSIYRFSDYLYPTPRSRHGTAVMDLIASPMLWIGSRQFPRCHPKQLHFVQLPVSTVVDTSGASLSAYVMAAIHDLLSRAMAYSDVLVNLSFGNHSGAHDGSSMIEDALVELLKLYDGSVEAAGKRLIVVLPAGNSHLLRCHSQGHAIHTRASIVDWKVMPDDDTDNFIEIWLPRNRAAEVRITAPDGSHVRMKVGPASSALNVMEVRRDHKTEPSGILFHARHAPQSTHSAMLLLAVGGNRGLAQDPEKLNLPSFLSYFRERKKWWSLDRRTPLARDPVLAPAPPRHGIWRIEIASLEGPAAQPIPWHAYVQRGDVAPLRRRSARGVFGRQSYIVDSGESNPNPMFTLNGIATASHPRLFVIGAMERADGRISPYSASGPRVPPGLDPCRVLDAGDDRVSGPNWVVPADESRRRHGLLVNGVLGGSRLRMSGTSMAAATFTRHLWEYLSAGKTLESFCHPPIIDEPAPTKLPVEAPAHAPDFCRGEDQRILSQRPDGSL